MSLPVVLEPGSSWGTRFSAYRSALAAAQKQVWAGVEALVNTNLCMLNYTTGIRM